MPPRRVRIHTDMTPLVDVAFLLLIFFMSTTQFKPPEAVAVDLPASTSEIHVPETGTIILTITRAGETYISTERVVDAQAVPLSDLMNAIVTWRGMYPRAVVIVKGDRDAPFGVIADVMDTLAAAKTLRFNLMTDFKERRPEAGARDE
ncbi:MAG: biopolymer transporter ExbD [Candidatus Krumholzibacteriota bacterium]|nr:biopolymer transporter ExbD [Candidatus Krumholzibacteriota bacterium]